MKIMTTKYEGGELVFAEIETKGIVFKVINKDLLTKIKALLDSSNQTMDVSCLLADSSEEQKTLARALAKRLEDEITADLTEDY